MKKNLLLRIGIVILCMSLTAGIYTFFVIPGVRTHEENKYEEKLAMITQNYISVPFYWGDTPLAKGTVITEALFGLFRYFDLPASSINEEIVLDIAAVTGTMLSGTLSKGEPLTYINLNSISEEHNGEERLKEIKVSGIVCGKVFEGTFVDIIVSYGDGKYDVVLTKKRVYHVEEDRDGEGMYTLVLGVTEKEFGDMKEAANLGTLETRLYYDSEDPASYGTFGEVPS